MQVASFLGKISNKSIRMLKFSCWKNSNTYYMSYPPTLPTMILRPPSFTLQWVLHTHRLQLLILTHFMTLLRKSHLLLLCRGLPLTFCPIDGVPCIVFQIAVADNSRIGGKWKKVSTAFIERMTEWDFVMAQTFALLLPTEITARGKSAKISFVANVVCNFYLKIAIFCSHGNRRELVMQWFVLWR